MKQWLAVLTILLMGIAIIAFQGTPVEAADDTSGLLAASTQGDDTEASDTDEEASLEEEEPADDELESDILEEEEPPLEETEEGEEADENDTQG